MGGRGGGASRGAGAAGSKIRNDVTPDDVLSAMRRIDPGAERGALITMRDLRREFNLPKEKFDELLLQMARDGKVSLHRDDFPGGKPANEVAEMVFRPGNDEVWGRAGLGKLPSGDYYVGVNIRQSR